MRWRFCGGKAVEAIRAMSCSSDTAGRLSALRRDGRGQRLGALHQRASGTRNAGYGRCQAHLQRCSLAAPGTTPSPRSFIPLPLATHPASHRERCSRPHRALMLPRSLLVAAHPIGQEPHPTAHERQPTRLRQARSQHPTQRTAYITAIPDRARQMTARRSLIHQTHSLPQVRHRGT